MRVVHWYESSLEGQLREAAEAASSIRLSRTVIGSIVEWGSDGRPGPLVAGEGTAPFPAPSDLDTNQHIRVAEISSVPHRRIGDFGSYV